MIKELKIPKVNSDLNTRIINAIDDYIKQQDEQGQGVTYNEIIGAIEFVKLDVMDEAYNNSWYELNN